jgi:hypothetical protein
MALTTKKERVKKAKHFVDVLLNTHNKRQAYLETHPDKDPTKLTSKEIVRYANTPAVAEELATIRRQLKYTILRKAPAALDRIEVISQGQLPVARRGENGEINGYRYVDHDSPDAALRANKIILEAAEGKVGQKPVDIRGNVNIFAPATREFVKRVYKEAYDEYRAKVQEKDSVVGRHSSGTETVDVEFEEADDAGSL